MFGSAVTALTLLFLLLSSKVSATDKTVNPDLVAKLKTAATQLDRLKLLPENSDWIFDYNAQPGSTFSPGSVVNANVSLLLVDISSDANVLPTRQRPSRQPWVTG